MGSLPGSMGVRGGRGGYRPVPVSVTLRKPQERRRIAVWNMMGGGRRSGGERSLTDAATVGTDLRRMRTSAEEEDWIREDIRVKGLEAPTVGEGLSSEFVEKGSEGLRQQRADGW